MPTKRKSRKRDQDGIYDRADSPYWWTNYTGSDGRTVRRSTGVRREDDPRKEKAKAKRAEWLLEANAARAAAPPPEPPPGPTFDALMVAYLDGPSLKKRDPVRDMYSFKELAPVFQGRELASLSVADARDYIKGRLDAGAAHATVNKEIGMFSAALNWARYELEWDAPNPFMRKRLKEAAPRNRWLTPAEAAALLRAAQELPRAVWLADFIAIGLYTGLRPGEILALECSRVDLSRNLIYFAGSDQKNGKDGSVPINARARAAFIARARFRASWCADSPWVFCNKEGERIASVKKSFAAAVKAAGLKDVHPHDLRRTCASWLAQAGESIHAICRLLRHSDIRVTERVYAHLSPDSLRNTVAVLDREVVSRSSFTLPDSIREIAGK